jgi:hypothetical protein
MHPHNLRITFCSVVILPQSTDIVMPAKRVLEITTMQEQKVDMLDELECSKS